MYFTGCAMGQRQLRVAVILFSLCSTSGIFFAGSPVVPPKTVSVKTHVGEIVGKEETITFDGQQYNVTKFLGIPYAEPPIGQNRFRKTVPKAPFSYPFSALDYGASCLQGQGLGTDQLTLSEDCLFLNIFLPGTVSSINTKLPVMLWIHGGGFTSGTSTLYPGDNLSPYGHVIIVTINYRVAELGFLRTKEQYGNFGLWDQHHAIRWVNNNIGAFGGDINNITVFGESAGSSSVVYQSMFPGNKNLFQRAIAESGGITSSWAFSTDEYADSTFVSFTRKLGCTSGNHGDIMACLRNKTKDEIANVMMKLNSYSPDAHPNRDNDFIPMNPLDMINPTTAREASLEVLYSIDFMMGSTSLDGALFLPYISHDLNISDPEQFKMSRNVYETKFVPDTLKGIFTNVKQIPQSAVDMTIFEYTNWQNPDDDISRTLQLVKLKTHCSMFAPMVTTAQLHTKGTNHSTYIYELSTAPSMHLIPTPSFIDGPTKANHADDLLFLFGFPDQMLKFLGTHDDPFLFSDKDIQVSKVIMSMWTNFAKTGDPNMPYSVPARWPQYKMTSQDYLDITPTITTASVKHRIAAKKMEFWLRLLPKFFSKSHI